MGRIIYKKGILPELKKKGYTTTRLRKEWILSESAIQFLREGKLLSFKNLAKICGLLGCDISDILVYVDDHDRDAEEKIVRKNLGTATKAPAITQSTGVTITTDTPSVTPEERMTLT